MLYLEDNDIAAVTEGKLSIHRLNRQAGDDPVRAIQTLQMELQEIMKGQMIVGSEILEENSFLFIKFTLHNQFGLKWIFKHTVYGFAYKRL